jgi:hypothetical protein
MWFHGTRELQANESPYLYRSAIGLATSKDGLNWTLANGGAPVFEAGPQGAFDQHSVSHPFVLRRGGRYMMWYAGANGSQAANSVRVERLGLATSTDGIHWTRENGGRPVIDVGKAGSPDSVQVASPCVVEVRGRLYMWYGAYSADDLPGGRHTIVMATSNDGIRWQKAGGGQPVEGLSLGGEWGELGPSVYYDGQSFLMLYNSDKDGEWKMYAASSRNGTRWTRLTDQPLLGPSAPPAFDSAGPGRNRSVHPSQLIVSQRKLMLWYTGEDAEGRNRIGLMESVIR